MKTCNQCHQDKSHLEFYKDKHKIDGLRNSCKVCSESKKKERRSMVSNVVCVSEKSCCDCGEIKGSLHFHKDKNNPSGLSAICKPCRKIRTSARYQVNKEYVKIRAMKYYEQNKDIIIKKSIARNKHKIKTDWKFRIIRNLRNRLWYALKFKDWKKTTHFAEYIGCDKITLMEHLESTFTSGMSWENYGSGWHIDHKKPLSNAKTEEQMYERCHYTNLQALWGADNIRKSNKEDEEELNDWLFSEKDQ